MKTVKVTLFTIKNKENGKRVLMELFGEAKNRKEFRDAFDEFDADELDFRTVRYIHSFEQVSSYTGKPFAEYVYDSRDNFFYETKE